MKKGLKFSISILSGLTILGIISSCSSSKNNSLSNINSISDSSINNTSSTSENLNIITIAEAIALCTSETESTERYYIKGNIKEISNTTYGEMTIQDETGSILIYGSYSSDGTKRYSELEDKPIIGDKVLIYGTLCLYNGTPEIKSGWIISITHSDIEIDESQYISKTIKETREVEDNTKVKLEGYVSQITYAYGQIPDGIYLVDKTGSIYVYSKDIASQVSIGNKITILGSKTHYILDSEKENAAKFSYKGCLQIENATLKENDSLINEIDYSWCEEKTIKDIMKLDVSNDITTSIYKTTALIKKVTGTGFTNYYIDDLDEKTGSYVYTKCSGADFTWLDEFDGKICTIYLSVINAKSSSSGCIWRFMPIKVIDENYVFDTTKASQFVLDYYIKDQFEEEYTGDPVLEVITSVSSTLLNFENVTITYTSSSPEIIDFVNEDEKLIMHAYKDGNAEITLLASNGDISSTEKISINVSFKQETPSIMVKEALEADFGSSLTVKGIVGPSITNKTGFYLIDETGSIAIIGTKEQLSELSVGNEIIVTGTKTREISSSKDTGDNGTTTINVTDIDNLYGKVDYSTSSFVTSTLSEISELSAVYQSTETIYKINAGLKVVTATHYVNAYLIDETNEILLYSSSENQYSWAFDYFEDETIRLDMEIAMVNFNGKQKPILLSVISDDGTKVIANTNLKA